MALKNLAKGKGRVKVRTATIFVVLCLAACVAPTPRAALDPNRWISSLDQDQLNLHAQLESVAVDRKLSDLKDLRRAIREELSADAAETKPTEALIGPWIYRFKREQGFRLPLLYRRSALSQHPSEELVLNSNLGFGGIAPSAFGAFRISPDGNRVAFTLDLLGDGDFRLFTEEIGGQREAINLKAIGGFEWSKDGKNLAVLTTDSGRPDKLHAVRGKTVVSLDYHLTDPTAYLRLIASAAADPLLLIDRPGAGNLVRQSPLGTERLFLDCPDVLEADQGDRGVAVLCSDTDGVSLRSIGALKIDYRPASADRSLRDLVTFPGGLAVQEFGRGPSELLIWSGGAPRRIMAPNETSEFHLQPDRSAGSTAELELRSFNDLPEQAALLGGLRARRTFANSADGTEIPLTIIDSGAPLKAAILRVYGAYGSEVFPAYDPVWLPLIRRGVAEAICHTRGGGYFGPKWHQAGIRGSKQRGTEDLIACAKALKHSGVSNVIPYAKSAGAVLAANALSQHPELFAGAVLDAPLLAIEATLTDSTVPHGARERLEWGDATEIALVDPVRQVRAVAYPPILVTARSGDPLVRFRDALWWLQLVRERTTGEAWNGVYISGGSSHLGEDHQFQDRDIAAMRWSFVIAVVEGRV